MSWQLLERGAGTRVLSESSTMATGVAQLRVPLSAAAALTAAAV